MAKGWGIYVEFTKVTSHCAACLGECQVILKDGKPYDCPRCEGKGTLMKVVRDGWTPHAMEVDTFPSEDEAQAECDKRNAAKETT